MASGITSLLWFVAILALIPLALWLLKRTPAGGAAAHGVLRTVAVLPLSASQRLMAVEVGRGDERRWLVLGVTPQSITPLHTLTPGDEAVASLAAAQAATPFAQLLDGLKRKSPGSGHDA
jgi:flagellar protein FliO/FliZ